MKKKYLVLGLSLAAMLSLSNTAYAGDWKQNQVGWWWQESNGSYPTNQWKLINGKWYYFDQVGYMVHDKWIGDYYLGSDGGMLTNTITPDGYQVDASGKWVPAVQSKNILDAFVKNRQYTKYTSDWYYAPSKYAYLDIDGDGNQELVIVNDNDVFFNALICAADSQSGTVKVLDNSYNFGSLRYSANYRALVLTDFRVNAMMGDYAFMGINGSQLVSKFHMGWDRTEGSAVYYRGDSKISEQEFEAVFDALTEPDYMDL